ncbi:MAG TPA: hypothetical protein DCQ29_14180, partial [Chitinophagaceae bacterium]|nr:hypothetical protein [Chitinophagaceae bacterium]
MFEYGWLKRVTQYDSTGKVLSDNDFANGEGTLRFKHHDGSEYITAGYKHYMRNGWYISKYPNGQVSYMQHYTNGLKDSISKEFYVDGKLENEGTYVLGKQHGVWKYYHPNGKLNYTETYKDGNEQGQVLMYNDDGTLDKEINYKDGVLHGNYKIYAENNQLAIQLNYKNGEIVSYTYEGKDGKLV